MANEKKQDSTEEKQKHELPLTENNANENKTRTVNNGQPSQSKEQKLYGFWKKLWYGTTATDKSNIILAVCSIATLILIYFMSSAQNELSKQALIRADSSNKLTRESLKFAKQSANSSDIISRKSLTMAETSMSITQRNNEINNKIAKMSIRPFLLVQEVKITKIIVGQGIEFDIFLSNYGKTPAQNIQSSYNVKIGGHGVFEKEFHTIPKESFRGNDIVSVTSDKSNYLHQYGAFKLSITKSDSIYIKIGEKPLFIYGYINYTDFFRESHTTQMCFEYDFAKDVFFQYERFNKTN